MKAVPRFRKCDALERAPIEPDLSEVTFTKEGVVQGDALESASGYGYTVSTNVALLKSKLLYLRLGDFGSKPTTNQSATTERGTNIANKPTSNKGTALEFVLTGAERVSVVDPSTANTGGVIIN